MNTLTREKKGGYTQGAWEGKMYDPNLSTKEIAERVRFFFKKQYPTCKVSVQTQYYSGGSAINIALLHSKFLIKNILKIRMEMCIEKKILSMLN